MTVETAVRMPVFMPADGAPKVAAAIVGVKNDIEKIPKSGRNLEHKYDYVEATVLTAKIQDAMVKNKLVLAPREVSRSVAGGILFIKFEYDAYCEDQAILNIASFTGASRFQFRAGTHDDKSASKCLTASLKGIEIALFKIPADVDDIERDRPEFKPPDRPPPSEPYDDRRGFEEPEAPPADGVPPPTDEGTRPPDGEPEGPVLDRDVRTFRHELRNADTRGQADDIWMHNANLLDSCSDQIFNLLRDDYQDRWNVAPPKLP